MADIKNKLAQQLLTHESIQRVKLLPITRHGKNVVSKNGNIWVIVGERNAVCCDGRAFFLTSTQTDDLRWVAISGDKDFKVEVL